MNQQSDSSDLLGGHKPVDLKFVIAPVKKEFEEVFREYFDVDNNREYLKNLDYCFNKQKWNLLFKLMMKSCQAALGNLSHLQNSPSITVGAKRSKRKGADKSTPTSKEERDAYFLKQWTDIYKKLQKLEMQLKHKTSLAFSFIEGSLVKAIKNGFWVLLDEINLANAETLECLSGLLEGKTGSISLLERGDRKPVVRHPEFTLFACMNPSTDVGKRDLPTGLRNRFTEFFVDELEDKNDLLLLVESYLRALSLSAEKLNNIVKFYLSIRKEAQNSLSDGLGHKPHYSLRTLCRALMIAARNPCRVFSRSLYEAFCLSFLTQLDTNSYKIVEGIITKYILGSAKNVKSVLNQPIPQPTPNSIQFEGYWVTPGTLEPDVPNNYILTDSIRRNLKDLVRVVSIGKSPVLLQGDTSVGKTSLIMYLAKSSGNKCVRINNHEHTDLQEYIGSYVADVNGKLVFREGLLVEAMRKGHWLILDELNLAPTDVLEALNRVLDDNRELFIAETQETVKAHTNFMLFATQNPPGLYGGRKMLSRAFRNRFVELHFNEIPSAELEVILHRRCEIPLSYSKKMVAVMTDLQTQRRGSAAFAGKQGFITLRDLFRWGERYHFASNRKSLYDWDQHLADEGYLLLAGRVRKVEERNAIAHALEKQMKRKVIPEHLFTLSDKTSTVTKHILEKLHGNQKHKNIVWTFNMRQLAVLIAKALEFKEPVLLVGETGGGKTTACQLLADNNNQTLFTVNCHMHTESGDFIGGLRPVRDHSDDDLNKLFEWVNGPLIKAMVEGGMFLADEISLADDSVLERLNSLLEPERSLLLAEKGVDINNPDNSEFIIAHDNFYFVGTMNPGGDYGKKELSPALRNRFTEIWCESCTDRNDLEAIIEQNIDEHISLGNQQNGMSGFGLLIMDFVEWFKETDIGKRFTVSIRDILTWVNFINACADKIDVADAFLHGACLTFLDSFGSGITSIESSKELNTFQNQCVTFLINQLHALNLEASLKVENLSINITETTFGIDPFFIPLQSAIVPVNNFAFEAPTCTFNTLRLLRGLQLNKSILLEGSPGVGKTSLVTALAKSTGNRLLRINLSDQTDISDLFGADFPVEGGSGGHFAWRDGPFLQALKKGHWILLDELNLASQSVLEGLNACLDHRGEIFIPELGKTFHVKPGTRLFACQNPLKQGGSRRGLPQSFLNRFTQVYINPLNNVDLQCILTLQFPSLTQATISNIIEFNSYIVRELEKHTFGYKGSPWEFNLRDVTRWCEAIVRTNSSPQKFVELVYSNRMRILSDKQLIHEIFQEVFGFPISGIAPIVYVTESVVHIGDVCLNKAVRGVNLSVLKQSKTCLVLRDQVPVLRSLSYCVKFNLMAILVGCSGSGKSSVVQTLANLVGKTLRTLPVTSAMDTTDILGGFEQVDYTRHLEEISKEMEMILLETIQNQLIKGNLDEGVRVLELWEKFSKLMRSDTATQTMAEETKLFIQKLKQLEELWCYLKSNIERSMQGRLKNVRERGTKLMSHVVREQNLNVGGKFEWVDSILIKCLQEGSWLLIDNVNLCSPAVLDRLNALLEPNGVLTIGERGVKENGEMIEIKPHEDFRLFLTMDPKNGEISRAMRNRGIEIYLLNETDEEYNINELDLKSLINNSGLSDACHIEALLKMHNFITGLILGEKPNIHHLLQASFLTAQQLLRGIDIHTALSHAVIDVYYKSRACSEFSIVNALEVIEEQIEAVLCENADFYHTAMTLRTNNLAINSHLEKIKQQTVFLADRLNDNAMIHNFLINAFTVTNYQDLQMRHSYLQNQVVSQFCNRNFIELNDRFYRIVRNQVQKSELVLDSHWLPDCDSPTPTANKLYVSLYFDSKTFAPMTSAGEKIKRLTLLNILNGVRNKQTEGRTDDILEKELLNLLDAFDNFFTNCLQSNHFKIEDSVIPDVLALLHWRFILYQLTQTNTHDMDIPTYTKLIDKIHIHYRWFVKNSIQHLFKILNVEANYALLNIVSKINSGTTRDFSMLRKLAKMFQKSICRPPPPTSEQQILVYDEYKTIVDAFNLNSNQNDFRKVLSFLCNNSELRELLISARACLSSSVLEPELKILYDKFVESEDEYSECKTSKVEVLPILDHFARLTVINLKNELTFDNKAILAHTITVPSELLGTLQCYNDNKNEYLKHELHSIVFVYLANAGSVCPSRFNFDEVEEAALKSFAHFTPVLSYLITNLLVLDINHKEIMRPTTFGNYLEASDQHRQLNLILWRNALQISHTDYDFITCESRYISNSFQEFVTQLSAGLNVTNAFDAEVVELCIERIREKYEESDLEDRNGDAQMLTTLLRQCRDEVRNLKLKDAQTVHLQLNTIANAYFLLSYLKTLFNSKLPLIDPLVKLQLKKQYCLEEIEEFSCIVRCYELQNSVYSGLCETTHGHVPLLKAKIEALKDACNKLSRYVAVRPEDPNYSVMSKEILHYFNMVLTPQHVTKLFNTLESAAILLHGAIQNKSVINTSKFEKSVKEASQLRSTYLSLITILKKYRYNYSDIVAPLLSSVAEFLYGFTLKTNIINTLLTQYKNMAYGIDLNRDLINIVSFPVITDNQRDYVDAVKLYTQPKLQNFLKITFQSGTDESLYKQENLRLLKCGIQELYNIGMLDAQHYKILDKKLFMVFEDLLKVFISAWKWQQEELERKRKEEESLYKIASKTEEVEIEDQFNELFPSFHDQDFSDLEPKLLDDELELPNVQANAYVGVITLDDVKFVSQIHSELLYLHTKTEWLFPSVKNIHLDFISPLLAKCKLYRLMITKYSECFNYTVDAEILNDLNVLVSVAQNFGDVRSLCEQTRTHRHYDFYKDANVTEVKASFHVLEELRLHINELLNQWPDHPTLKTIVVVIERIFNFDMASPLSRFLTGFEILLSKCHEWEENAHSGVSLQQYIQNLVQQIITWRKIEMNVWKESLNIAFERMNESIAKWWFYIYEVMLQFIEDDKITTDELLVTLQKFITQSNLAEYSNRLGLLLSFHYHATHFKRTEKSEILINIFWNVYKYFQQFESNVQSKIKELRSPIEKKLKEYIKIVRWKDISYWAIKQTVERTHKTLHKHIREFENVLKQPVTPCLGYTTTQTKAADVGVWDKADNDSIKKEYHTTDLANYMANYAPAKNIEISTLEEDDIFTKTEKYFKKSRTLCKNVISASNYPSLVQSLDEFVIDVIHSSNHLQNLEVDTTLTKEKQKSQAKGILQQKRKALADLFKALTEIGLSYRTGIVQSRTKDASKQYLTKPIDLHATFLHLNYSNKNDEKIVAMWNDCETYYYKALSKLDALKICLRSPAKDLGLQNLERCSGFSENLMQTIQQHKSALIKSSRTFFHLRFYLTYLKKFCEDIPHARLPVKVYDKMVKLLKNIVVTLEQYKVILNTCPEESSQLQEVTVLNPMNIHFIQYKHDRVWQNCVTKITLALKTSQKLLATLTEAFNYLPSVKLKSAKVLYVSIPLDEVLGDFDCISMNLQGFNAVFDNVPMTNSSQLLVSDIDRIKVLITENSEHPDALDVTKFKLRTRQLFRKILVVIQNIYKNCKTDSIEEDDFQLKRNLLKTLIIDDLSKDFNILDMSTVLNRLHSVVIEMNKMNSSEIAECRVTLLQIVPLLEQIILLYQYFFAQQVYTYRVTCKMSSILFNIFTELATKGFCVPPEFSEELNSEGDTQQVGGGLGLGEGEGERDVSDRIESEDQLEDAEPAGKEKDKQEDKDCKEEEKGIEMSEDFDAKMQDIEKGEDDEDNKSESDDDAEEQMGETEKDADQLDQQIWGTDDEANESENEESKEEKGDRGEKQGQDELGAKENNAPEDNDQDKKRKEAEEKKKEINEMKEPEYDDDQIDPYHGNPPQYPEPEAMDLPDDLQVDDDMQEKNENLDEENPFDIDTMKEQAPPPESEAEPETNADEDKQNPESDVSDDDTDRNEAENVNDENEKESEDKDIKTAEEKTEEDDEKEAKENQPSALDETQTNDAESQAMDVDNVEAGDNVKTNPSKNQKSSQPNEEICQEDKPDKEGVGQSRMEESKTGHKGQASAQEDISSNRQEDELEAKRKPGETDSKRSLGDVTESVKKKLKTIDVQQGEDSHEDVEAEREQNAEMYQHIKEATKHDDQVLDTATKEQAEEQKDVLNLQKEDEVKQTMCEDEEDDVNVNEGLKQKAEKVESEAKRKVDNSQHPEGEILEEVNDVDIEGEIVSTMTVARGSDTTHHTQYNIFDNSEHVHLSILEVNQVRAEVERQLSEWIQPPTTIEAEHAWKKISSVTSSLAQGLSEQLRLVLEPTQASRLKGDYRTGRRINMRKVIPYIASQFRKDKIWLRRTKPSKREYQIALAIDDSSSMSDNHSKELAFESVALISKALTLLESGQLAVLSFGETTEVLHKLTDTFTEKSGSNILQKFKFSQRKTCIAKLVDFATEMLNSAQARTTALIAKLLIIVSDGRGIFSEGETYVQQAVRRAKLSNIFMVFVIIDNPESKDSILDIRMPIFKDGKLLGIKSYMDSFPFPFYIILRNINSLPNVLSDALRQWFEIVSNVDKQ